MIQDIYPHKLDNHYDINAVPDMDSIVLYFTEEGVLHRLGQYKEYDNYLFFPAVRDFPSDTTDIDEFPFEKDDLDRKSTRLNSSHPTTSRMPSSA